MDYLKYIRNNTRFNYWWLISLVRFNNNYLFMRLCYLPSNFTVFTLDRCISINNTIIIFIFVWALFSLIIKYPDTVILQGITHDSVIKMLANFHFFYLISVQAVTLHTDLGDLKLELFCENCPKTCENFLALCASDYYNSTVFHRNIPKFMIQGGDPTGIFVIFVTTEW